MKKHFVLMYARMILCVCALGSASVLHDACAQEEASLDALTKKVMAANNRAAWYPALENLTDYYFAGHKYDMYVALLKTLAQDKKELAPAVDYFIALTRFTQLGHLEEAQDWEEYFAKGTMFRQELESSVAKAIEASAADDPLAVHARFVSWRYHDGQKDVFSEKALSALLQAIKDFAEKSDDAAVLKDVAGQLYVYGQKSQARQVYAFYVQKLVAAGTQADALRTEADAFYKSGNAELAKTLYDAFLVKATSASPKDALRALLVELAQKFSAGNAGQIYDYAYAEALYQKIEAAYGKDAFDEALLYARAFNQEKAKEYGKANAYYQELLQRFAQSPHRDEAMYKAGIITTYVLRDITGGKVLFEALASKEALSPQVISGMYQLGLLSQWKQETGAAKKYYTQAIEKAQDSCKETVGLAKLRLAELVELKPIDYALKAFLDASLLNEAPVFDASKVSLQCDPFRSPLLKDVGIKSATYPTETGCIPVEIQYLWSGHIGSASPDPRESSFVTTFSSPGTKEINLVLVSPAGTLDRNLDFVDVE